MKLKKDCTRRCGCDRRVEPTTCEGRLTVRWPFWVESGSVMIRFIDHHGRERHQTLTPGHVIIEVPVEISQ